MEKGEKFLPIGTVVMLEGGTKKLMITGFCVIPDEKKQVYDYVGCLYPEGMVSSKQHGLFNHNQCNSITNHCNQFRTTGTSCSVCIWIPFTF